MLQGIDNFFPDDFFCLAANAVHPLKNPNLKEIQTFGEESKKTGQFPLREYGFFLLITHKKPLMNHSGSSIF